MGAPPGFTAYRPHGIPVTQVGGAHYMPQPPVIDYGAMFNDPIFIQALGGAIRAAIQPPPLQNVASPIQNRPQDGSPSQRVSTPTAAEIQRALRENQDQSPTNLTSHMQHMRASDTPTTPTSNLPPPNRITAPPAYIPAAEQALVIHQNSADSLQTNANIMSGLAEFMSTLVQNNPNPPPNLANIAHNFAQQAIIAQREATVKNVGLQNARKVTQYYETPISKPAYPRADNRHRIKVNHKELLVLTGYFDPNDKSHDFKHTWQKLLDYGSQNEFQEEHYMQALGSILKQEAYETYVEFKTSNKSLTEILDYFANVYTKKRNLADDRRAVDEFTRRKGESITVCMDRAILSIDKLRHLHPEAGWPTLRQQMRHNILMQVVKEETKRAIQMEVDHVYEDTGMPYDFVKLIRFADRYERNHNAAPKDEVTTLFKVASGGIHTKREKRSTSQDQLAHLKKEQMLQKQVATLQAELKTIQTNEARLYKNEGRSDRSRESRRTERDSRTRQARSTSYDKNRNLDKMDSKPTTTSTSATSRSPSASNVPTRVTYKPPDPYSKRPQSKSPYRRDQTPSPRNDESNNDRRRSNSRSNSQNRNRSGSNNRYSKSSKPPYNSNSRPNSRPTSATSTDRITSTGSKTVIITINGQDYPIPLKKEN
jgi:hypothetical protein